jgi:hypothetical protein
MNRNDRVTLDQLVQGDRFYKLGDKKQTPLAVKEIKSRGSTVSEIIVCPSTQYGKDVKDIKIIKNPQNYMAVYLRHDIDIA